MGKAVEAKECVGEGGMGGSPCRFWADEDVGVAMAETEEGDAIPTVAAAAAGSNANANTSRSKPKRKEGFLGRTGHDSSIKSIIWRLFRTSSQTVVRAKTYARTGPRYMNRCSLATTHSTLVFLRA